MSTTSERRGGLWVGGVVAVGAFNTGSKTVRRRGEHSAQLSYLHATAYGEHVQLDRRRKLLGIAPKFVDDAGEKGRS
jgi:hypothetical protein